VLGSRRLLRCFSQRKVLVLVGLFLVLVGLFWSAQSKRVATPLRRHQT